MRQVASSRGWRFEACTEGAFRVHRWRGVTDGVEWVAESLRRESGEKHRRRRVSRWHGRYAPGIDKPIVIMGVPKGAEAAMFSVAQGEGLAARLVQKAAGAAFDMAVDWYFGQEVGTQVDAGSLRRIEGVTTPGFIVMAADKDEAKRVLSEGLERALVDASNLKDSVLSQEDRPYVLIRRDSISLARMQPFYAITDVDAFVRAGVALTHAFRFGHR
jgi:hypothetical protein